MTRNDLFLYARLVSFKSKGISSILDGVVNLSKDYSIIDLHRALLSKFPKRFHPNEAYSLSVSHFYEFFTNCRVIDHF